MNHTRKTISNLFLGLTVLLATFAIPITGATAGEPTGNSIQPINISEEDSDALLEYYRLEGEVEVENITIKIYNNNDELIYSTEVCQKEYDCDERLIRMINDSDFITEIDNTRIYFLDQ